jgi:hypothetical protein
VWANHLRRLDGGSTYESSASYRHWKLHGAELEENWDTINVSHEVRAEQIRRRSRSQSRRRKALEKERAPQTTAGRLAEGARSATEWAQHQEIQSERASSSGGVIAVPTLTPWHDLPGGTISKWLDRPPMPSRPPPSADAELPPRPKRPAPSADAELPPRPKRLAVSADAQNAPWRMPPAAGTIGRMLEARANRD